MGQMSSKFGEIIKKLYQLWKWAKPSHMHSVPPPPPHNQTAGFGGVVFHVVEQNTPRKDAKNTQENHATKISGFRGEGGVTHGLI